MPKNQLTDSGFDRVAPFYDRLAKLVFGDAQERAQLALLPFIPAGAHVLIIGGGSGWLLEQLLIQTQPAYVLYLDASPAMLRLAQNRYQQQPSQAKVEFRLGTEAALQAHEQFDIIITPFLLDLFPEQRLSQLMAKLYTTLAPAGHWLFADFLPIQQPPPLWQRLLLRSMYLFFGVLSHVQAKQLPDFGRHFEQFRQKEVYTRSFYRGMIQAKVYRRL